MAVITMTREMGSLGKDVAAGLGARLGLEVVHRELVEHDVAERMAMSESDVHRFLEGRPSLAARWKVGGNRFARCTAEEIVALAERGDVLIRGWGATSVLRRVPHVLRVRVCAPMARRVRTMQERLGLADPDDARREIERSDAAHARAMRGVASFDWENPLWYDLVLNTERVPIEECVRQVESLARSAAFERSEGSRRTLSDLRVETRVQAAVAGDSRLRVSVRNLDLTVADGVVSVTGAVHDRETGEALCRALQAMPGVRSVDSRLIVPGAYTC